MNRLHRVLKHSSFPIRRYHTQNENKRPLSNINKFSYFGTAVFGILTMYGIKWLMDKKEPEENKYNFEETDQMINDITIYDLADTQFKKELIEYCEEHPFKDKIIKISNAENKSNEFRVMCGSHALFVLSKELNRYEINKYPINWYPNDIDIFIFGSNTPPHIDVKYGNIQNISVPYKDVQSLLSHFDVPVTKLAITENKTYYISIQCLYSIYTKKMNLPSTILTTQSPRCEKIIKRIDKYKKRGYLPIYHESDFIPKCISKGLTYYED